MEIDPSIQEEFVGHRTLAAIVFTDGVNFSARMSTDEEHTLNLIRRDLQFMKEQCWQFEGQVVKSTGDGLLMYFISAVDAVRCALEIQKTFLRAAMTLSPRDVLSHRIGIHLGDVFISETDAMGNGVNIAARLLTEAEPGTICVSQTVYDVVRSNLALEATYLGRRELKNIQELVPVYRIRPVLQEETPAISPHNSAGEDLETRLNEHCDRPLPAEDLNNDESLDYQEPPRQLFDRVVKELEQNPELTRIKKLIFYACINRWENDLSKLTRLQVRGLIQELLEIAPTLGQIHSLLSDIVKTINKQAEYTVIANIILSNLQKLYPDSPAVPYISLPHFQNTAGASIDIYAQIASELEKEENALRIKKLIFYICKRFWENDQKVINNLNFRNLVQELHTLNPTPDSLVHTFNQVVSTISKAAEYKLIAKVIINKFKQAYANNGTEQAPPEAQIPLPAVFPSAPTANNVEAQELIAQPSFVKPSNNIGLADSDIFNLRLEIIKYSNPLRAKILVFSVLNLETIQPDSDTNFSAVKTYEMDGLLRELLDKFQDHAGLAETLEYTAKQLDNSDQSSQAARVISKAIKPLYEKLYG